VAGDSDSQPSKPIIICSNTCSAHTAPPLRSRAKAIVTRLTPVEGSATEPAAAAAPLAGALVPPIGKKALSGAGGVALKTTDGADTSSRGA
jgi:hypothetical protein